MIIRSAIIIAYLSTLAFAQNLRLELSHETCTVGEPITLTAVVESNEMGEIHLTPPSLPHFHLADTHTFPVRYGDGKFVHRQAWTLQPTHSGEHSIPGASATFTRGAQQRDLQASALRIEVLTPSPAALNDTAEPAPIPADGDTSILTYLLIATLLGTLGFLIFKPKKTVKTQGAPTAAKPSISSLVSTLKTGRIPTAEIHILLESTELTPTQRRVLERALYSGRCDAEEILKQLEQEAPA